MEDIEIEDTVGIDLGITKFIHDSDGRAVFPADGRTDHERIEKRHQAISRNDHESNNWETKRQRLGKSYELLSGERRAYREELANAYTKRYDTVVLEDLNVSIMMNQNVKSRNIMSLF